MKAATAAPPQSRAGMRIFLGLFFSVFLVIGSLVFNELFIKPVAKFFTARGWRETPCVVVSSEVSSHRASKGGTIFSAHIVFRYAVDGREIGRAHV